MSLVPLLIQHFTSANALLSHQSTLVNLRKLTNFDLFEHVFFLFRVFTAISDTYWPCTKCARFNWLHHVMCVNEVFFLFSSKFISKWISMQALLLIILGVFKHASTLKGVIIAPGAISMEHLTISKSTIRCIKSNMHCLAKVNWNELE